MTARPSLPAGGRWYETARSRRHLLVIVRDPSGRQHDDFFVTSDTTLTPAEVTELYSDRWAIEDANRNSSSASASRTRRPGSGTDLWHNVLFG